MQRTSYFPVNTYISLQTYLQDIKQESHELHVFSTNGVGKTINQNYYLVATSIQEMQQAIFGSYFTSRTYIYLQALCRQEIVTNDYKHQEYLLNRIDSIVRDYYLFIELGVNEITYRFEDSRRNEVLRVINFLLKHPLTLKYWQQKRHLDKKTLSQKLVNHVNLQKIHFYEIEYMTFGRISFIFWLKMKGFDIEFHVPYDLRSPKLHRFWNDVYQIITNIELQNVTEDSKNDLPGNNFAFFYENKDLRQKDDLHLTIMEFATPHDFSQYVKKRNERLIAVEAHMVRPIIENESKPLYENDIGKFIYFLQFCKLERDNFHLTYETFCELLTSAFVKTKVVEGKQALPLLLDLEEYVHGVETLNDIKERLQLLISLDTISRSFDKENAEDVGRNRIKRYMLNPFRSFAYLNHDRYEITYHQLVDLVHKLEQVLYELVLSENITMNVNEYFNRWKAFINRELFEEEQKKFWLNIFNRSYPDDWHFSINELLQLIYFEATIETEKYEKVKPFDFVQEIIMDKSAHAIHITNITQMNFPEMHTAEKSSFFSHTDLKYIIKNQVKQYKRFLYFLYVDYTVIHSFEDLSIFRLYQILSQFKGKVTLSWIKNLEENSIRNIYFDILADLYCNGKIVTYQAPIHKINLDKKQSHQVDEININHIKGKIPNLYWLDHDFCAKKFFLTTFIDQYPIYENHLHQQFVFSKIGRLLTYSDNEREKFRQYIYPLFPQWTYTRKENLIDLEFKTELYYKTFENISYPKQMNRLQILRSVYRENRRTKARNLYRKTTSFNDKDLLKQFLENIKEDHVVAEPGNHCKMCPHLNSCLEGMYAIDNIN